jgi:beta-galactosidase beta subunit
MGYATIENMNIIEPYDEAHDFMKLNGNGIFITFPINSFFVLFPSDIHMPRLISESKALVQKVVIKVKI